MKYLQIASQFLEQAPHHKLVHAGAEEEGDKGGGVFVDLHRRYR